MANYLDAAGLNIYHNGATINEKKLPATLYVQDIRSKNLFNLDALNFIDGRINYNVKRTKASDGTGVNIFGTAVGPSGEASVELWANPYDNGNLFLPEGNYTLSYEAVGTGSASVIDVGVVDSNNVRHGSSFTVPTGGMTLKTFFIKINVGVALDCSVYILLRESSASSAYVPYAKTNVELTNNTFVQDIPSKNLLPNNTSTTTTNGVTFTVNADGSISTSGTAIADTAFNINVFTKTEASKCSGYILSGCPAGGSDNSYYLRMQRNSSPWTKYGTDYGNGVTLATINEETYVFIGVISGTNMNSKIFYPMIRPSTAPSGYVPHAKTNVELTNYLSGAVVVEKITSNNSETLSAGQTSNRIFYIDKAGYTPLGVVGFGGSGTAGLAFSDIYIDTIHTAKAYYANHTSGSKTINSLYLQILYLKN